MTARVWTCEELDRVHPLPEGWTWEWWEREQAWAICRAVGGGWMYFDADGRPHTDVFAGDPPREAVLALCLASKGLDSMEAMADEVERFSTLHEQPAKYRSRLREVAAMLRRGTVAS